MLMMTRRRKIEKMVIKDMDMGKGRVSFMMFVYYSRCR